MRRGYNISLIRHNIEINQRAVDEEKKANKAKTAELEKYLLEDGRTLDSERIISHLFSESECDVFISHSHKDQDLAIQIALNLRERGITAFVDSTVWGSSEDLLKKIDEKHCRPKGADTYNYKERNQSTAHVHMILMGALQKMIFRSPVLFFLNTENSLSLEHSIKDKTKTHSAWLYGELLFSRLIWEAENITVSLEAGLAKSETAMDSVQVAYTLDISHLKELNSRQFSYWLENLNFCRSSEQLHECLDEVMR